MLQELFAASDRYSVKWSTYFPVYERTFSRFIGKGITFVEVGASTGASLQMWKAFFQNARIIGIDIDPASRAVIEPGIEIVIGDQASPAFWAEFYKSVGPIDVLLDDGGHTNEQQIVTVTQAVGHIRDGGVIMVEDVHASYMEEFLNPSRHSFINFAKGLIDDVNSRSPFVPVTRPGRSLVSSLEFHESIVVLNVDRRLPEPALIESKGIEPPSPASVDAAALRRLFRFVRRLPVIGHLAARVLWFRDRAQMNRRLAGYFHSRH